MTLAFVIDMNLSPAWVEALVTIDEATRRVRVLPIGQR
jgi:hypothetical protein